MAKPKTYVFRPLKGITLAAVILIVAKLIVLALVAGFQLVGAIQGTGLDPQDLKNPLSVAFDLASIPFLCILIVSGIVSLMWIYGAARNTRALRPEIQMTPGWAVGWFFVPFASLYKPYETVRDIWLTSFGPAMGGGYRRPAGLVVAWWWSFLIGNACDYASTRIQGVTGAWVSGVGYGLGFLATALFLIIVRGVTKRQMAFNTRVAEIF